MSIRTSVEAARGCGYRKEGGYYLVAPELSEPCPRLPITLDRCPHCGQGIGPSRGLTWITPSVIIPAEIHGSMEHQNRCPLGTEIGAHVTFAGQAHINFTDFGHRMGERAGLIWVGGLYYPTAESFMEEAARMGVSRRIKAPPRGFKVGEDWILLGHRKASWNPAESPDFHEKDEDVPIEYHPGIITVFQPTAIEYIVKGTETDEEIEALEKRGISPVKVIRDIDA